MATSYTSLQKALQRLDTGRIGELNLLVEVLARGPTPKDLTCWAILQTAGKCDRIPIPDLYIPVAEQLGVVRYDVEGHLELTQLGNLLLEATNSPPHDQFNQRQLQLLAPELLGDYEIRDAVVSALQLMTRTGQSSRAYVLRSTLLTPAQDMGFRTIQVLGFTSVDSEHVTLSYEGFQKLLALIGEDAAQTEQELWASLQQTNLRARAAEEYVVEYEQRRLREASRRQLSELVDRISRYNARANYDVRSFELDGQPRYIEVKSSTNLRVQFYWSSAERAFAKQQSRAYWIYFIPRAQELPHLQHDLLLIQDPVYWCGSSLAEEPSTFRVSMTKEPADLPSVTSGDARARFLG